MMAGIQNDKRDGGQLRKRKPGSPSNRDTSRSFLHFEIKKGRNQNGNSHTRLKFNEGTHILIILSFVSQKRKKRHGGN